MTFQMVIVFFLEGQKGAFRSRTCFPYVARLRAPAIPGYGGTIRLLAPSVIGHTSPGKWPQPRLHFSPQHGRKQVEEVGGSNAGEQSPGKPFSELWLPVTDPHTPSLDWKGVGRRSWDLAIWVPWTKVEGEGSIAFVPWWERQSLQVC